MNDSKTERGFTLPELLVVAVFFCCLAVFAAWLLHPKYYGVEKRNAQRWTGIAAIAQAVNRYVAANNGQLPQGLSIKSTSIASASTGFNLCTELVPKYFPEVPLDPNGGLDLSKGNCADPSALYVSGYSIYAPDDHTVVIGAPHAENNEKISIVRKY